MCSRWRAVAGIVLAACLEAHDAWGMTARITLARASDGDDLVRELTARTAGEVVAAGFSVELREEVAARGGEDAGSVATIFVGLVGATAWRGGGLAGGERMGEGNELGVAPDGLIEITVEHDVVYRAIVSRADVAATDGGRTLSAAAVRAVAALQTALQELQVQTQQGQNGSRPRARAATGKVVPADVASSSSWADTLPFPSRRWGLALAASMTHSPPGLGPTYAPMLRASYAFTPAIAAAMRIVAAGSSTLDSAAAGSARVRQDYAGADVLIDLRPGRRLHPVVMGGVGVVHLNLQGAGVAPYLGRNESFWGVAADTGLALFIDITPRLSAIMESHAVWSWPRAAIDIDTTEVGSSGRPALVHGVGLVVWL